MSVINRAIPSEGHDYLFVDFCIGNDISQRLDLYWREQGICEFNSLEITDLIKVLQKLSVGNTVILKKVDSSGDTMSLFGYGYVRSVKTNAHGDCYLDVWWTKQDKIIQIPLIGCNAAIKFKSLKDIHSSLSAGNFEVFGEWLEDNTPKPFTWYLDSGDLWLFNAFIR